MRREGNGRKEAVNLSANQLTPAFKTDLRREGRKMQEERM
jgi:hypothetical protein